jgi:aspartate/methionine/tyrosine aminotransferase
MNQSDISLKSAALVKAERLANIEPFHVVRVITRAMELQSQGKDIVNLAVGEPDFSTPKPIIEAGVDALRATQMKYSPSLGTDELRAAVSRWYASNYGLELSPNRVAITSGASGALLLCMGVIISPGDKILMPDPSYPCNRHFVTAMGGNSQLIPVGPDTNYQLTAEQIESNWDDRTVGVMIASPSNPTGTLIEKSQLKEISDVVERRGGVLIVDEIYQGLTYGSDSSTSLEISDNIFVINSFSKYFAMTGWRLGWAVLPDAYVSDFEKLAQNLYISNSDVAQKAAIAAFSEASISECEANRARYREQRDYLLPRLRELGFKIPVDPMGAIYIYADVSDLSDDSFEFSQRLLEHGGVAIAPGLDFGDYRARQHVRFSYPKPVPVLEEGVRRIKEFLTR